MSKTSNFEGRVNKANKGEREGSNAEASRILVNQHGPIRTSTDKFQPIRSLSHLFAPAQSSKHRSKTLTAKLQISKKCQVGIIPNENGKLTQMDANETMPGEGMDASDGMCAGMLSRIAHGEPFRGEDKIVFVIHLAIAGDVRR